MNKAFLENLAHQILDQHSLAKGDLVLFSEGTNIVFSYQNSKVIKIFPPFHHGQFQSESLVLTALANRLPVNSPILEYQGEIGHWPYIIMTQVEGVLLENLWESMTEPQKLMIIRELGSLIQSVHTVPTPGLEAIDCHWEQFIETQIKNCVEHHREKGLPAHLLQ